jgi:hypothetical protein
MPRMLIKLARSGVKLVLEFLHDDLRRRGSGPT